MGSRRSRRRSGKGRDLLEKIPKSAIRLLLVRHGQTSWNDAGRIQGVSNIDLDDTGLEQARRIGVRLASVPVAAIYASDLSRAVETARIIWEHQQTVDLVPLRTSRELREICYGEWEGKTREDLETSGWGRGLRRWQAGLPTPLPPGAETKEQAQERVARFLTCVTPRHGGETVVVVGHGGTLRLLLCQLLGLPASRWGRVRIANTGLSEAIVMSGGRTRVLFVNDTEHLRGMSGPRLAGPLQAR